MARQSHKEINFSLVWMKPYLIEFQSLAYRLWMIDIQIDILDKALKHYWFSSFWDGNRVNEGPTSSCMGQSFTFPFCHLISPSIRLFLAIAINNPLIRSVGKCDRDKRWHRIERGKNEIMLLSLVTCSSLVFDDWFACLVSFKGLFFHRNED